MAGALLDLGSFAGATIREVSGPSQITISEAINSDAGANGVTLTFGIRMRGNACIGDDPSILLQGGKILFRDIEDNSTHFYDIARNVWSGAAKKAYEDSSSEEGWAKVGNNIPCVPDFPCIPDGSVLTYDISPSLKEHTGYAELYNPSRGWWGVSPADGTALGTLPLLSTAAYEIGPVIRLLDGRMFQIGANGETALFTPSTYEWTPGPRIVGTLNNITSPSLFTADDAPAAILPNGHVIFAADAGLGITSAGTVSASSKVITGLPALTLAVLQTGWAVSVSDSKGISPFPPKTVITSVDVDSQQITISEAASTNYSGGLKFGGPYSSPAELFDFDPVAGKISLLPTPDARLEKIPAFSTRMLILPTGHLLLADGSNQLYVYADDGLPTGAFRPTITSVVPTGVSIHGTVYTLTGTQITGQSAGSSYGDDVQSDENYPIIRMVSESSKVYYARTMNWSSVDVATGATPETVEFTLNPDMPPGRYSLIVSAAGISSEPMAFYFRGHHKFPERTVGISEVVSPETKHP